MESCPSKESWLSGSPARKHDRLVLAGLLLVACVLTARLLPPEPHPFNLTHWLFSYQDGLHSRALVGSLAQVILGDHRGSTTVIAAIAGITTVILVVALVLIGYRYWRRERSDTSLLNVAVLVACPGTIQFFAHDTGRLDQVGYLIVIAVCFALLRMRGSMQWLVVSATSVILCLIHEAFVVMLAPTLIASVLLLQSNSADSPHVVSQRILRAALSLLPAIALAAALVTVGRPDYDSQFLEVVRRLNEVADFDVSPEAVAVQFRTLGQNALYTYDRWFDPSRISDILAILVALLPSGTVAFFLALRSVQPPGIPVAGTRSKILQYAVMLCCMAPLALVFLGHDYGRWGAVAVTNLFLVAMIAGSRASPEGADCQNDGTHSLPKLLIAWVVLFSLAVGPMLPRAVPYSLQRLVDALRAILDSVA